MKAFVRAFAVSLALLSIAAPARAAEWTPSRWTDETTLQFRSVCPGEGEHWSYVWLVVLDGDVWIRLGSRAAARVDCNASKLVTAIRVGGEEFASVEMVPTPAMATRVADAMAAKYTSDLLVRYANHPYTMKLVPKDAAAAPSAAAAAKPQ
jgi:hypothetical protein